ncbi:hypothetical protein BpHYR1_031161 [Brachionus plicatilis]|uniref:Uncharacterized protein n=1 Tax=Brachionus plicatilis TaxID=10195 RepID=A0A3M7T852_BRAPC|nr:hypothetical protein BpHYR1_031161 [Brachionus plicatilis]
MNQTYTIEAVEVKKSESREQIKKRLSQMRSRAQKMISKHNWQRFVHSNGNLVSDESLPDSTIFNRTKLSKIDIDSVLDSENSKINFMPLLLNKTEFTESRNTKMFEQEEEYKLSLPKIYVPKRRFARQDSVTFIADLASTSTPTKSQPITSTPKKSNHNPMVYHPKKTIRNKTKKAPTSSTRIYKINIESFDLKLVKSTKRKIGDESECKNCNVCQSAKKSKKLSQRIKLKGSNIEFSLEDLLYKPAKGNKKSMELAHHQSKIYFL